MKFYQFLLLLLFIFVSSIFGDESDMKEIPEGCKMGGSCSRVPFTSSYKPDQYWDKESPCFYYLCRNNEYEYVNGSGKYEDFINACKYVEPEIKKVINASLPKNDLYVYHNEDHVVAACPLEKQKECEQIIADKNSEYFDLFRNRHQIPTAFTHDYSSTCFYNNTPLAQLPQVQCDTGGTCTSGKSFYLGIDDAKFVTKTCDACVMFVCSLDGKQIIEGSGCYEDFVKACNSINPNAVAKFKENIKNNFYHDKSMIVASCSDADNCHKYAFDNYNTNRIFTSFFVDQFSTTKCSYEEIMGTVVSSSPAPEVSTQQDKNGITSIKLFSGIYFLLVLIY